MLRRVKTPSFSCCVVTGAGLEPPTSVIVGGPDERLCFCVFGADGLEDWAFVDFSNRGLTGPRGARRLGLGCCCSLRKDNVESLKLTPIFCGDSMFKFYSYECSGQEFLKVVSVSS